jgi:hypothetical protein
MSTPAKGLTTPPIQWVPLFFPRDTAARRTAQHSPPPSAEVKNEWSYTPTPHVYLHGADRDKFIMFNTPVRNSNVGRNYPSAVQMKVLSYEI